jgi:hypothetical protein
MSTQPTNSSLPPSSEQLKPNMSPQFGESESLLSLLSSITAESALVTSAFSQLFLDIESLKFYIYLKLIYLFIFIFFFRNKYFIRNIFSSTRRLP